MANPKYAFIRGEIVPYDDATVHVASGAFKFGTAVFEGLRGYWNEDQQDMYLFRMDEHMQRLEQSQMFMRYEEIIAGGYVAEKTKELIHANGFRGNNVHIMTTTYVSGAGGPGMCGPIDLTITAMERPRSANVLEGVTAQVSSWMRIPDNAMPMRVKRNANYHNGRLATVQASADGYVTAIMLNSRGKVSEGPGQCFFMVRNGKVITPSTSNDLLESITRDTVLELLAEMGIETVERDVDRSEIMMADEAFFCGTAWEVAPILGIDKVAIGSGSKGPITSRLQKLYFDICDGSSGQHTEWRMPVYAGSNAKAAE